MVTERVTMLVPPLDDLVAKAAITRRQLADAERVLAEARSAADACRTADNEAHDALQNRLQEIVAAKAMEGLAT